MGIGLGELPWFTQTDDKPLQSCHTGPLEGFVVLNEVKDLCRERIYAFRQIAKQVKGMFIATVSSPASAPCP